MTVERLLRLIAGVFVLVATVLGYYLSPYWLLFTAFVALNLIQSAFTNWCPMMTFLRQGRRHFASGLKPPPLRDSMPARFHAAPR